MTKIDFTDLAQRVRKRLDEVFPEDNGATAGFGDPPLGLAASLAKAGKIAAAVHWKVPRHAIGELAAELRRIQSRFPDEKPVALLIKVQLELCRYIDGCRAGVHPQALTLLQKSSNIMARMAADPKMPAAAKQRATRQVLADFSALKAGLLASRNNAAEAFSLDSTPVAKPVGRRTRAAIPNGPDSAGVLRNRAYYLIPISHLEKLTRFIEKELGELHAAIAEITPRSG